MQEVMITPGTFFDGYIAVEYKDPIYIERILRIHAGEVVFAGGSKIDGKAEERISETRKSLIDELKKETALLNCNGIIGFKADCMSFAQSVTIRPQMVREYFAILITVQGTPVRIVEEKK